MTKDSDKFRLIPVGPAGSRVWPFSIPSEPKPFLKYTNKSFLALAIERALLAVRKENVFFIVPKSILTNLQKEISLYDLSSNQIIIEPLSTDTAGAFGYAAAFLLKKYGSNVLTIGSTDFETNNNQILQNALSDIETAVKNQPARGMVGTIPSIEKPDLNGGYAVFSIKSSSNEIYQVDYFKEKPTIDELPDLIKKKSLLNIGKISVSLQTLLSLYEVFLPDYWIFLHKYLNSNLKQQPLIVESMYQYFGTKRISFAKNILEGITSPTGKKLNFKILMKEVKIKWVDLGCLNTRFLSEIPDKNNNIIRGCTGSQKRVSLNKVTNSNIIINPKDL